MPGNRLRAFTFHVVGGSKIVSAVMRNEGAREVGIDAADFVLFQGGVDISPHLYEEKPHAKAQYPDFNRDAIEEAIFRATPKSFHVGICRGAQLLHVLNGGALWQHVEGHLKTHDVQYTSEKGLVRTYSVSSTHHQMMKLRDRTKCAVWAFANETRHRELQNGAGWTMSKDHWTDPEIVYYKDTNSLCFQPHPEHFSAKECRELFYRCLHRMIES